MVIHLPQTLQLSLQLANMNSEFLSQSPLCCHVVHLESSSLQPIFSHKSKNTEMFVYFTTRFNMSFTALKRVRDDDDDDEKEENKKKREGKN